MMDSEDEEDGSGDSKRNAQAERNPPVLRVILCSGGLVEGAPESGVHEW
jgi:hypothetical protein